MKEIFSLMGGVYIYAITPIIVSLLLFQTSNFGLGIFSIVMWILGIINYMYTNTNLLDNSETN